MSVLRSIEHRIESLVEGVFGRAFPSHVQPVELARKLAKEMDDHKTVSVSRVYVPNEYLLYLAPTDRERFRNYEQSLLTELSDYLSEHARREGYALLSTPRVILHEDTDLALGDFGIATRMVQPRPGPAEASEPAEPEPAPGATKAYRPPQQTQPVTLGEAEELGLARAPAVLSFAGRHHEIGQRRLVIGRSHESDVQLADPNVSRRHAEIQREDGGHWVVDLGSTNGVEVNGKRVERARLEHGDRIVLGSTEITFEQPS